jgi:S-adenosylmethionine hydrolase
MTLMNTNKLSVELIACFTDFGCIGPYQGQMLAVLATQAPKIPCVTLMSDAPMYDPYGAGILLERLCNDMPAKMVVVAVVDPGVGGTRRPLMVKTPRALFVGPDNGLFVPVVQRSRGCDIEIIEWRPERLSESFHGRDLFAPVAAKLANGEEVKGTPLKSCNMIGMEVSRDNHRIIYIDHYGNAITNISGEDVEDSDVVMINDHALQYARTFSEVSMGQAFWYRNSIDLLELAVNCNSAVALLNLKLGMPLTCVSHPHS